MAVTAKFIRPKLELVKPLMTGSSLETARQGQTVLGKLMSSSKKNEVETVVFSFPDFPAAILTPKKDRREGVILYLHGGGYTCGDLDYARGFGSVLCAVTGRKVLCPAYRLAPEHPFPAALDDAVTAYRYLLNTGFSGSDILLCGESAGGGLIYCLAYRLRELELPLPAGFVGISPWTDLTASGASYAENENVDPSMTKERLGFFAGLYSSAPSDPLVSPLFGEMKGLPPSLLFVGGDEIMRDDAVLMRDRLTEAGCEADLTVEPGMWHVYPLYGLKENQKQVLEKIAAFADARLPSERKLRWMKVDNAGKIYPAAKNKEWTNLFRLSMTLAEPVDPVILQSALDVTVKRFPSIAVRLRRGIFWYYLEEVPHAPKVKKDGAWPLVHMVFRDTRKCAFRVLYYENRIAVELFHAITDGSGGMIFLKTLVAEYLTQKHSIAIKCEKGVLNRGDEPTAEETEDSFVKNCGTVAEKRENTPAFLLKGEKEPDGRRHLTCGILDAEKLHALASEKGVTVTVYLAAVMVETLAAMQNEKCRPGKKKRPVKVLIPVNLRPLFGSKTLRNFAQFVNVGIDPNLGDYTFDEILSLVHHQLGAERNAKTMQARFTGNVKSERSVVLRLVPLFLKNVVMKAVFNVVGEAVSCLCFSNLGKAELPDEMANYVERIDFVLGSQAKAPYNAGLVSWNGKLYLNIIRTTVEPELEYRFFTNLMKHGIRPLIESNDPDPED